MGFNEGNQLTQTALPSDTLVVIIKTKQHGQTIMLCIISDISNQFLHPLQEKKDYQQALCFPEEKTSKLRAHRAESMDEADLSAFPWDVLWN